MKTFKILLLGLSLTALLVSCDLDQYPYDSIERSQALQSVDDAEKFSDGLYSLFRNRVYGRFCITADIQSDIFHASSSYGNRQGMPYRWLFTPGDYEFVNYWGAAYRVIANTNYFLGQIDAVPVTGTDEVNAINTYKGEAYFLRAYYTYVLVKAFAKDYDPATASADLGIPVLTSFDVSEKPARSTVALTYQQILDDITSAKGLLKTPGALGSNRITVDAITALEARVHLAMHSYGAAVTAADALITGGKYPLVTNAASFKAVWHNDNKAESILQLFTSYPSELTSDPYLSAGTNGSVSGTNGSEYLGWSAGNAAYSPDFIPEKWVVDLYEGTDIRKDVFFANLPVRISGKAYSTIFLLNKYPGNISLRSAPTAVTNYQHAPKVFRIAEMHLIKAEALAMQGGNDGPAQAALNVLKTARGATTTAYTGAALLQEIKNERVRELVGEGFRLDDLKRWGDPVNRGVPQELGAVLASPADGTISLRRDAGHYMFVWAIPSNDITVNTNLKGQQNPGY